MSSSNRPARWALSGLALCLVVGLAACVQPRAEGPVRAKRPDTGVAVDDGSGVGARPEETGPEPSWSTPVDRVNQPLAQVGRAIVVPDERQLRAVDRSTGQELWRHPFPQKYQYVVAGELIVATANDGGTLEVLDAATGGTRWRAADAHDVVVDRAAVYHRECVGTGPKATCALVAQDLRDGHRLWRLSADRFATVSDLRIGARLPYAPAAEPYVSVRRSATGRTFTTVAARTGKAGGGRLPSRAWYGFTAGSLLVATDHDPARDDRRCTVEIATVDAATGEKGWSGQVFSGRTDDGECEKVLAHHYSGTTLLGTGTRLVAVTATGRPQLVELRTGRTLWQAPAAGTPIDGDDRSVLVRRTADSGALTLLDLATGQPRWTAPDPGLSGESASWRTTVTGRFVAVSGATEDRPFVLVHDAQGGRLLGRYPGWLAGAGDDWVAVIRSDGSGGTALDVHTF
ncbi:PQQ-binding-like beta-propeller repeat protein [Micromonospora sp. DT233]|uniref:outer membrane protein assembly factor BamB family protein n=1 Tax=Micromonospora sp. DT233 TaxID=3393432 RepID=UPI003CECC714